MCVLMLRGPQTPGELKQRCERLHAFAGLPEVDEALDRLVERGLVARHARRPGQKEERYEQLLGGGAGEAERPVGEAHAAVARPPYAGPSAAGSGERLDGLERELAELREEVRALRLALGD
jgi:hypothetical protein